MDTYPDFHRAEELQKKKNQKTAAQLVYEFCKENGICIQCQMQFAGKDTLKCDKCREQVNNSRRKYYQKTGK
jgi:tRNA(Ile2) C34 agmatinyltransferase TiaS